jgi:hypothetical protein
MGVLLEDMIISLVWKVFSGRVDVGVEDWCGEDGGTL